MCGACGGGPPDPDGALVAGPRRRAEVARLVGGRYPALTVRAVPGGWTVATRTGRATVHRTLTDLLAAAPAVDRAGLRAVIVARAECSAAGEGG